LSAPPVLGSSIGDIDLRWLRVFRAVTGQGGLTAAPGESGLDPATISRHMADPA